MITGTLLSSKVQGSYINIAGEFLPPGSYKQTKLSIVVYSHFVPSRKNPVGNNTTGWN